MAEVPQRLVTIDEAARILSRSRSSIWRDVARGVLEVRHIGRSARITLSSIDKVVERGAPLEEPKRPPLRIASERETDPADPAPDGGQRRIGGRRRRLRLAPVGD